jgi:small subunit ribosomal protein S17
MADEPEETTADVTAAATDAQADNAEVDTTATAEPVVQTEPVVQAEPVAAPAAPAAPAPAAAAAPAKAAAPTVEDAGRPNRRKVREGVVVSDAMQATVVVAVVERVRHPRYGKTVQRTKKLYVHDAEDTAKVGDRVRVQETRPLSKLKRWRLTEVVERAR